MPQDKETLREVLESLHWNAFWDGAAVMFPEAKDCKESFAKYDDILADIDAIIQQRIDAAIATMFERLRTPSDKALRAGCNKIDWERNSQEHMPTAPNGIVDLNSTFLTPGATTIGQDMLDAWQAMLAAFQQENSDA